MLKLTTLSNVAQAMELCERLRDASIDADVSHDVGVESFHLGWNWINVWIRDDADINLARVIATTFLEETTSRTGGNTCLDCGYDLRGHSGEGRCPECGHVFVLPQADVRCPKCSEDVPANFASCWNCGADLTSVPGL